MALPESYYGAGSYNKWIRVGWALRNISNRLLIVWIAFSAKSATFTCGCIPELCDKWSKFDHKPKDGVTCASIMYWVKTDNPDGFKAIRQNTVSHFLDQTIYSTDQGLLKNKGCSDYDIAIVLHQLCKGDFVYCSGVWWQFKNHRWMQVESGSSLRLIISNELRDLYQKRMQEMTAQKASVDPDDAEKQKVIKDRIEKVATIHFRLGSTRDKKNIMQESSDLFNDPDFMSKLDTNPYLLCFKNGVVDLLKRDGIEGPVFRDGKPEDYLTKCTGYDYTPIMEIKHREIIPELHDFMSKVFPDHNVREYMWDHLSSVLIGTASVNQTFNNYIGGGQNGKSVLTDLMSQVLGSYKVSAPISLITQGRVKIGGLAPEIVLLQGARYTVMQEPSKGDVINEGPMKELVSGVEPITARAPYMTASVTFIPQFKLVVCANEFMTIKAQDHGTWRRIRVVPFEALFTENPVKGDPDKPYQFKLDRNLKDKFPVWRETFVAMLVERAYKTQGVVTDCDRVLEASNEYRKRQDYLAEFIADKIIRQVGSVIRKSQLSEEFKVWFNVNFGTRNPSPKDLHDALDRQFGKQKGGVWKDVRLKLRGDEMDETPEEAVEEDLSRDGDVFNEM
jgi:P4 family phage/plasmid primase-like protien